ncbi:MAG TPA: glycoside hydrolase family 32 protein [Anaerolineaceae bacterium]
MAQTLITITIQSRHLHFPVKNGNPRVKLQLMLGGLVVREFDIELATGEGEPDHPVDWWAFYDVSAFTGQPVSIQVVDEELSETVREWLEGALQQSDGLLGAAGLYAERYRPQFHYTSRRGWNNDPNGMVFVQGEWHLYYQHNPFGTGWGNMHWGHAVSTDLVEWQELPEALYQKSLADMAFSGGGLIDLANTAGFKSGSEDPLVVAFTSSGRGECLAYSLDRGRTFHEYTGNPFLTHHGRDPKIIWYEPDQKWVMILYEELAEPGAGSNAGDTADSFGYAIYDSPDLKHWTRRDFLPGFYECPELFELPVVGQPDVKKWVVHGTAVDKYRSAFMIGSFDGMKFTPEMESAQAHYGPHFYAAQIFNQAPGRRCILIGWLTGAAYPDMPFSQGMTVPLELSLHETSSGIRLFFYPVEELSQLHTGQISGSHLDLTAANKLLASAPGELFDLDLCLQPQTRAPVSLTVGAESITYDPAAETLSFAGQTAHLEPASGGLALRVLVDRSVMEVFANQGEAAFSAMTLFPDGPRKMALEGDVAVPSLTIHTLRSIWGHRSQVELAGSGQYASQLT